MAVFGLFPDWTIMVLTSLATLSIIGFGFYLLPHVVFPASAPMWAVSVFLTFETILSWLQGLTVQSYSPVVSAAQLARAKKTDEPTALDEGEPTCAKCAALKPQGTHHCRVCRRCVVGMDHHCFFLHTCIGDRNQLYFIKYVMWVMLSCAYVSALCVAAVCTLGIDLERLQAAEKKRLAAFTLAMPAALLPALAPFFGLLPAAKLTAGVVLSITGTVFGAALLFLHGNAGLPKAAAAFAMCNAAGIYLGRAVGLLYHSSMCVGVAAIVCCVFALITAAGQVRAIIILFAGSTVFGAFTFFLLLSHLERVARRSTLIDDLKGEARSKQDAAEHGPQGGVVAGAGKGVVNGGPVYGLSVKYRNILAAFRDSASLRELCGFSRGVGVAGPPSSALLLRLLL